MMMKTMMMNQNINNFLTNSFLSFYYKEKTPSEN